MTELRLSPREALLLNAALNPDPDVAATSWQAWAAQIELEVAPVPELRLLTAVYEHLSAIAPALPLPQKLRGKARATFTRNQLIASGSLEAIGALEAAVPVLIAKGLAFCARFGAWSSRQMGDADIYVPQDKFAEAVDILANRGWVPKYGLTLQSLLHRTSLRRNSWNLTKGHGDIDLHWRIDEGPDEAALEREMWDAAEPAELLGAPHLIPSPEFATILSLNHGFIEGTRGDALQTIIDCSKWLPLCDRATLTALLSRTGRWQSYAQVSQLLAAVGLSQPHLVDIASPTRAQRPNQTPAGGPERAVLRRPALYCTWEVLGRRARVERLLIRLGGPLSKPLGPTGPARDTYDLRECTVIDELAGPGWGWPEPERSSFWSDRADCRLLVPLPDAGDHLIVLTLSPHRLVSRNRRVSVFANGLLVDTLAIAEGEGERDYPFIIPRQLLSGPWVELAFRPIDYGATPEATHWRWRSLPVTWLRVYDAGRIAAAVAQTRVPPLGLSILKQEQPQAAKFDRIRAVIAASPLKDDPRLPPDFDGVLYILLYRDLFEAELDPFEHFIHHGQREGRAWR
ncbi:MAG: nucleotidyltransferase family protein [Devosia sp.]|nr:nucleotidyltransferase family protein [Devosia sp.]